MTGTLLLDPPPGPPHTRVRFASATPRAAFRRPAPLRHRRARARRRRRSTRSSPPGSASSRSSGEFTGEPLRRAGPRTPRAGQGVPARPEARSPASATSTPTRRCSARASTRCGPANRLTRAQCAALARRGRRVARRPASTAKGATIDDFRDPDGVSGAFQDRVPRPPARAASRARAAATPVRKLRAAGRGTYVCERCQPRPRRRRLGGLRRRGSRQAAGRGRP